MVYTNVNSSFPSQVVPDAEKNTYDYGYQVGRAIENEWFRGFHRLRLYARGEQSVAKYKDELSINGDLSYLNLDWKPVAVLSKFVDIVVNGMTDKGYEIKSFATDPFAIKQRTQFVFDAIKDMQSRKQIEALNEATGQNFFSSINPDALPKNEEELELYMQLSYKQSIEIAEEELIDNVLNYNKYDEIKKRLAYDLVVLGISAVKTNFNLANGVTLDYVDPANLVYSYTEDPNFEDIYYVGELKSMSLQEVKKLFPYLTQEDLKEIEKYPGDANYTRNYYGQDDQYNQVQVLFFEYKTYNNQVFKIKQTDQGLEKALEKPDSFLEAPESDNFERVHRAIEVLYSGAKILGQEKMLKWELAENMTRPYSDQTKVQMNYAISAPRMYKGRIDSLVSKCIGFADMIQLTHLKIQQVLARMVPDGVFVDVDGLAEVDLGNGTSYNPQEALNMYFQTGSIVGRSLTQDGDLNSGKVPIQELQTSSAMGKIQSLVQTYQYYLQMIRDVTGLNEARDGSQPDKNALVGLQKLAAAASNTATKHILQSLMYLTIRACENISLKASDMLSFPLTKNALISCINQYNVGSLEEIEKLNMHEFGIFLELEPDQEEQQVLEQNIQIALQAGGINLEDAIDIRQIKNIKLANQYLKQKQAERAEATALAQQQNIQMQAQANAQASEQAALAEVQKQQALTETKLQLEQGKSQFEIQRMELEAQIKKQLMAEKFQYDMQLAKLEVEAQTQREKEIEDRKDERARIIGTQQSEMIAQRKNDELPKNFESSGFDSLGGFGLEQFEPR
jgi:hypothetical protein